MNVFVLNTGRCGSKTFTRACRHMHNYTAAHESRTHLLGAARFDYPDNHVEVDNRLSWLLGRLDAKYGDSAFYVHLKRCPEDTAASYVRRYDRGLIKAYRGKGIIMRLPEQTNPMSVALDLCETVNANIELFLKDKTHKMVFDLESAKTDFPVFWDRIGAAGDLPAALLEFDIRHNATKPKSRIKKWTRSLERLVSWRR